MDYNGWDDIGYILLFYFGFWIVLMLISIVMYVLQSIGLYKTAKRRGIHNAWLSWLPVGCTWIIGCISDQYQYVVRGKIRNKRKALLVLQIVMLVLYAVVIAAAVAVAIMVAEGAMYQPTHDGLLASMAVMMVAAVAMLGVDIALLVVYYIALYDLFRSADKNDGAVYLVLSILISYIQPILIFLCRNKDGGMPPRIETR